MKKIIGNSSQNEAPIIESLYDLQKKLFRVCQGLSKQIKFTYGQRSEILLSEIFEMVILAYRKPKIEQLPILEKADAKLFVLKFNIRLLWELGAIKETTLVDLQKDVLKIGKMLGGWIKSRRII